MTNSNDPLVSVVIPTRNRCRLLVRTIGTVLGQRDLVPEVIVIDEASSDGTGDYLRSLGDRVSVIRHDVPEGVAAARNAGLNRSSGDWVAFVDDDDLWAPDKLASQLASAAGSIRSDWVISGEVVVDEKLAVVRGTLPPTAEEGDQVLLFNVVPGGGSGTMVRTELARAVGGFDTRLSIFADWELWIRLYRSAPFAAVARPLVGYYCHPGSMSHGLSVQRELDHIHRLHGALRSERGVAYSAVPILLWQAQNYLRAGDRRRAVSVLCEAARHHCDLRSLMRAGAASTFPSLLVKRWDLLDHRRIPSGWKEEAEAWLAPLRTR